MQEKLSVLCGAPAPAQDGQKRSGGVSADNYSPHIGRRTRWNVLRELLCFARGRNHRTPPMSIPRDPKVATTPQGGPRGSLFGPATHHPRPNLNTPKRHLARWSGAHATGHGWTLVRSERPRPARGIFNEPRMRIPFPMHPCRCRRRASEDSNHCGEDREFF